MVENSNSVTSDVTELEREANTVRMEFVSRASEGQRLNEQVEDFK